jgi:hypothetical protein
VCDKKNELTTSLGETHQPDLPEKAVLLLDNAPGHPPGLEEDLEAEFNFIKIKFLPATHGPTVHIKL